MFEQMILSEPRKKRAVVLAFVGQVVAIGALITIPLLSVQQLPLAEISTVLVAPPPPPPPPPPPAPAATAPHVARVTPRPFDAARVYQPQAVPKTVAVLPDLPQAPAAAAAPSIAGVEGGVTGGQVGGVLGGVLGGVPSLAPPPPPPPPVTAVATPAAPAPPKLLRVGGQVEAAQVISAPPPAYPALAKSARIGGVVKLDAIIGTDGHIQNLKLISGPPLLIEAAMNAVKQWTYHPTILNGQPFKVETQIDVNFTLG
jgi:protein TonB